jgi:hypothetical protein
MLFVVDLEMVLSRQKRAAMDPMPKRKSQYGSRQLKSNLL